MRRLFVAVAGVLFLSAHGAGGAEPLCQFDLQAQKYAGSELEQARCLLPRFVEPVHCTAVPGGVCRGKVATRSSLGEPLESLVGRPTSISKQRLKEFLTTANMPDLIANLDEPLSTTALGTPARYFVIHDTSSNVGQKPWPADTANSMTRLGSKWKDTDIWKAHAWVNRLGQVRLTYDFKRRPDRSSTKFEVAHNDLWGLFLHTEVTQPRKAPAGNPKSDKFIPVPAFKDAQYRSTALLYVIASARAGTWLVPAYHIAIDKGIPDGHDDPQYFSLEKFSAEIASLLQAVGQP